MVKVFMLGHTFKKIRNIVLVLSSLGSLSANAEVFNIAEDQAYFAGEPTLFLRKKYQPVWGETTFPQELAKLADQYCKAYQQRKMIGLANRELLAQIGIAHPYEFEKAEEGSLGFNLDQNGKLARWKVPKPGRLAVSKRIKGEKQSVGEEEASYYIFTAIWCEAEVIDLTNEWQGALLGRVSSIVDSLQFSYDQMMGKKRKASESTGDFDGFVDSSSDADYLGTVPSFPSSPNFFDSDFGFNHHQGLGLANLGNTCYANSAFKILMAHPDILRLTERLPEGLRAKGKVVENGPEDEVRKALHDLLSKLITRQEALRADPNVALPDAQFYSAELKKIFDEYKKAPGKEKYIYNVQQDSDGFLLSLLELIGYHEFFPGFLQRDRIVLKNGEVRVSHYDPSKPISVSSVLNLEIASPGVNSIADAIRKFHEPTEVEGYQVDSTRKETIQKIPVLVAGPRGLPRALIVNLKRRDDLTEVTIDKPIHLTEPLEIQFARENTLTNPVVEKDTVRMTPQAVIVRHGTSAKSGHYYAYVYDERQGYWYRHNDREVSKIEDHQLHDAYEDMELFATSVLYIQK